MTDVDHIISQLEEQKAGIERAISALHEVSGSGAAPVKRRRRGRPPASRSKAGRGAQASDRTPSPTKRRLSPEGRKAIIDALKKRWAEKKSARKPGSRKATRKSK